MCVSAFLFCTVLALSQEFVYKHYDLQDGLPNPTIHAIFQDKDGFLWFGTESGLCRYDGNRFKTYTVKDGLPGNEVLGIFEDSKGRLWLQFYKHNIAYLYKGKIYNLQNDSLLRKIVLNYRLLGVVEDKHGNIVLCDGQSLITISPANKILPSLHSIEGRPMNGIALATDRDGELLLHTSQALYSIRNNEPRKLKSFRVKGDGLGPGNLVLHKNYFTNVWADSIFLKDTTLPFPIPGLKVIKYSPVNDSIFSANLSDGCILFYINTLRRVNVLPGIKVSNVFMDSEKNIWLGTIGRGLYKMSSQEIVIKKLGNNQNEITVIAGDGENIYAGNNNSELFGFGRDGLVRNYPVQGAGGLSLKMLHYEKLHAGSYLVANSQLLAVVTNNRIKHSIYMLMLKQVREYDDEHVLLAMHFGTMLMRKRDLAIIDTVWKRRSHAVFRTNDSVLVGTTAGLFVIKKDKGHFRMTDSLLMNANIVGISKTADNFLWVCTLENGLYCIKNGKVIRHFTQKSGLPSDNGRTLYTQENKVWLGTDQGLVKIECKESNFQMSRVSTSDGLPSNIINSVFVQNNITYVGTTEGLCYFDETKIESSSICNLVLTGVKIGDSLVKMGSRYTLRNNQQLTIEYSGISFRSEQETVYRYRINGLDETWRNTELGSLEFPSLPGGDYELEIIAINKYGKESLPLKLSLHVKKPFHTEIWFLLLVILIPAAAIAYAYNRRILMARRRQVQKLQQQIKITRLEQMALRAQMNPHFIFNCINVIQQLVLEKDTANTHKFITSFSGLVRQTLDNAPEPFIGLNEEIKFLTRYFELERIRLEDRFSYNIDQSAIKDPGQWKVPNMVIQPFVENAIKHGIRYKKDGPGFIEVRFQQSESLLRCTITDNGIGREQAAEMRKESGIVHEPRGMGITFKRIESLNTLKKGMVSIEIEDMKDEKGRATGTKVIIAFFKMEDYEDKDSYN